MFSRSLRAPSCSRRAKKAEGRRRPGIKSEAEKDTTGLLSGQFRNFGYAKVQKPGGRPAGLAWEPARPNPLRRRRREGKEKRPAWELPGKVGGAQQSIKLYGIIDVASWPRSSRERAQLSQS